MKYTSTNANRGDTFAQSPFGAIRTLTTLDGKHVATAFRDDEGRVYVYKSLWATRHFLRTPPAVAMDNTILSQAEALGAEYFVILDRDSEGYLWTEAKNFRERSFPVARGHNPQTAVPLGLWKEGKCPPNGYRLNQPAAEPQRGFDFGEAA